MESREETVETPLHIVRMHALDPSCADFLLRGSAGELEPRLIEIVAKTIRSGHPNQHGCRIGHHLEPSLTFTQPFLSKSPLCDIAVYGVMHDLVAGGRSDPNGEKGHVKLTAILALTNGFDIHSPAVFELICVLLGAFNKRLRNDEVITRAS